MIGIIIAGGTIRENLSKDFFKDKMIICADGGYDYALDNNISPSYIIGDFDSISDYGKERLKKEDLDNVKVYPIKKDKGDLELAIDLAIEKGMKDLYILGALGTRMDHSFTNILSIKMYYEKGIKITILDENNKIIYSEKDIEIHKDNYYNYISFIPIEESEISLKGFEYELANEKLKVGSSLQVSNHFLDKKGFLTIHQGGVFVIQSKD